MITRNDILDALTKCVGYDPVHAPNQSEIIVSAWAEHFETLPWVTRQDLLSGIAEYYRHPNRSWPQPAAISAVIEAAAEARAEREQLTIEEQRRVAAFSQREKVLASLTPAERDRAIFTPDGEIKVPASPEHRAKCMAEIRAILAQPGARFGMSPEGSRLSMNPRAAF